MVGAIHPEWIGFRGVAIVFVVVRLPHADQLNPTSAVAPTSSAGFSAQELTAVVRRAQCGDLQAQTLLINGYSRRIRGLVRTIVRDANAHDDIVQMAFIKALRFLPRLREPGVFEAWLFRLTRTICLDYIRRQKCRPVTVMAEREFLNAPDERSDEAVAEIKDSLERALRSFSERDQLMMHRIIEGDDYRTIAASLGVTIGAVKTRICRIRTFLRVAVGAETGTRLPRPVELSTRPCLRFAAEGRGDWSDKPETFLHVA